MTTPLGAGELLPVGLPAGLPHPDPHPPECPGQRCAQPLWLKTTHALREPVGGLQPEPKGGHRVGVWMRCVEGVREKEEVQEVQGRKAGARYRLSRGGGRGA